MGLHRFRGTVHGSLVPKLTFVGKPTNSKELLEETIDGADTMIEQISKKPIALFAEHVKVPIGSVVRAWRSLSGKRWDVEFEVDDSTTPGFETLCLMQQGVLCQLSLGSNRVTKTAFEVSIVQKGAREGTFITHAMVPDKSGEYTEVKMDEYIRTHSQSSDRQDAIDSGDKEHFTDVVRANNRHLAETVKRMSSAALNKKKSDAAASSGKQPAAKKTQPASAPPKKQESKGGKAPQPGAPAKKKPVAPAIDPDLVKPERIRIRKPQSGSKYIPTGADDGGDQSLERPENIRIHKPKSNNDAGYYEDGEFDEKQGGDGGDDEAADYQGKTRALKPVFVYLGLGEGV